ncbi:MAG: putative sulfate/molybdate transporter [bacterium]|nr:putative sulfate/molybdate transporter [bacterium]
MKLGDFEFNLRELSGSLGDLGTLFPLAVGYVTLCGLHPAGLLVTMGLMNIATGLIYRLPMPVEPMKVIAVTAIAQRWPPSLVYGAAFGAGVVWLVLSVSGVVRALARLTPPGVAAGLQLALGFLLARTGLALALGNWPLALVALGMILGLRRNRQAPAALLLVGLGLGVAAARGELCAGLRWGFALPSLTGFTLAEVWQGMVLAGFAQVLLTLSNAVIATAALIERYWPGRRVPEEKLGLNMGVANLVIPFFGGMPLCHGAGGLAGQYFFGARTGGANIMEGLLEVFLGLFLAGSVAYIFGVFPTGIVGAMMLVVGVELARFGLRLRGSELALAAVTAAVALAVNMAAGFGAGLVAGHLFRRWGRPGPGLAPPAR